VAPDARVVYADNDPIVLAHARALLTSNPAGRTAYLDADLCQVRAILDSPELHDTLDLSRPVAVSVNAIPHFFPDDDDPFTIIRTILDAVPTGSYLSLTHTTPDFDPAAAEQGAQAYRDRGIPTQLRSREEIARFFDGLELVEPGIQPVHRWRPGADASADVTHAQISIYGAVGVSR